MDIFGKRQTWDITGGQKEGRSYITVDSNIGTLLEYTQVCTYDVNTSFGEQRDQVERHVKKLRSEISNYNYTPTAFNASVSDASRVSEENGLVKISLDKEHKLNLIDGGHRLS